MILNCSRAWELYYRNSHSACLHSKSCALILCNKKLSPLIHNIKGVNTVLWRHNTHAIVYVSSIKLGHCDKANNINSGLILVFFFSPPLSRLYLLSKQHRKRTLKMIPISISRPESCAQRVSLFRLGCWFSESHPFHFLHLNFLQTAYVLLCLGFPSRPDLCVLGINSAIQWDAAVST